MTAAFSPDRSTTYPVEESMQAPEWFPGTLEQWIHVQAIREKGEAVFRERVSVDISNQLVRYMIENDIAGIVTPAIPESVGL